MSLDRTLVLHVVDIHTYFQNAVVLRIKRPDNKWYGFVEAWASVYVVYLNIIRLDQDSSFRSNFFRDLATSHGIKLRLSGIESHNSIGIGDRYHEPLRRVYRIVRDRYPTLEP